MECVVENVIYFNQQSLKRSIFNSFGILDDKINAEI